ncbi:SRPBCC family protein [Paenibacillus rigui]|uniref:Polyketide cyclase n=1 Tax=Paenibacillus rigui TaxID=554312 RepID=A0A229UG86_9BACL|nr:SRPBCC domain-containing protein [Paenibacillus rigui]OXM82408.1 polyketide cyclase [Paenibacillus rigui]
MSSNPTGAIPDICQTIMLQAPIQKVWDAVSTAEGIAAWFMPNTFEPLLGHEFTLTSPYGISPCKVTELAPPNRLAFDWGKDWHVSFELEEVDGMTRFTLVHSGWSQDSVTEVGAPHSEIRERMNHGWETAVLPRLQKLVEA